MNVSCFTVKNFRILVGSMISVFIISFCVSTVAGAQENEFLNDQPLQVPEAAELAAPGVPDAPVDTSVSIDLGVPGVPDNSDAPEDSDDLGVPGVPDNEDALEVPDTSGDLGEPGVSSDS